MSMPAPPGAGPGPTPKYKYCLNCDKCIRRTGTQSKSNPRKIGNTQVDGYIKYLEANGKAKTKEEVVAGFICNPCYCQYQAKYKGQYDQDIENRRKARANHSNPLSTSKNPTPSTSRDTTTSADSTPAWTNEDPRPTDDGQEPQSDGNVENERPEQYDPRENNTGV